jgi:GT2 family glycosyltransferase
MIVGVVVLHYRNWPVIAGTLEALRRQTRQADRIVVVDNASGDADVAAIRSRFPELDVQALNQNLGYAAGMNAGVGRLPADVDAVLLLTHECVLAPDALQRLVSALEADPRCAAVGPLLRRRDDGSVWSAGGRLDTRTGRPWHIRETAAARREADWLDGAALLVRAEDLRRVGGLDETYFLYYEELDLCLRLRAAGHVLRCVTEAVAWQQPGNASPYLDARNFPRVLRRAGRPAAAALAVLTHLAAGLRDLAVPGRRSMAWPRLAGVVHGYSGRLDRRLAAVRRPSAATSGRGTGRPGPSTGPRRT